MATGMVVDTCQVWKAYPGVLPLVGGNRPTSTHLAVPVWLGCHAPLTLSSDGWNNCNQPVARATLPTNR